MKKILKYFLFLTFIYGVLFLMKKSGIYIFPITDYAADLICLPWSLLLAEWLIGKIPGCGFQLNLTAVLVAILYFTLVFEVVMPAYSKNHTADPFDVLCYFAGGMFYLYFQRKKELSNTF